MPGVTETLRRAAGEQLPQRRLRVVGERRAVVEAENREGQGEEVLDAPARLVRILVVLGRHEAELTAAVVRDQVGAEEDARGALEQERVVRPLGPRRADREEVAGQKIAFGVAP